MLFQTRLIITFLEIQLHNTINLSLETNNTTIKIAFVVTKQYQKILYARPTLNRKIKKRHHFVFQRVDKDARQQSFLSC